MKFVKLWLVASLPEQLPALALKIFSNNTRIFGGFKILILPGFWLSSFIKSFFQKVFDFYRNIKLLFRLPPSDIVPEAAFEGAIKGHYKGRVMLVLRYSPYQHYASFCQEPSIVIQRIVVHWCFTRTAHVWSQKYVWLFKKAFASSRNQGCLYELDKYSYLKSSSSHPTSIKLLDFLICSNKPFRSFYRPTLQLL